MNRKSWITFYALMNDFTKGTPKPYLKFLPEDVQNDLEIYQFSDEGAPSIFPSPSEIITKVHYSWLAKFFKDLSGDLFSLYMSSLSEEQVNGLTKLLKREQNPIALTPFGKDFILTKIYKNYIEEQHIIPASFLPKSELNTILSFEKRQVMKLIDFLGIAELAVEIKNLDKDYLIKKVYECLPQERKQYLEGCMEGDNGVSLSSFHIDKWDGDKKKLAILLHQKGIARMGASLSGQETSLVWHICHKLDTGRAIAIQKHVEKKEVEDIAMLESCLKDLVERFQQQPSATPQL